MHLYMAANILLIGTLLTPINPESYSSNYLRIERLFPIAQQNTYRCGHPESSDEYLISYKIRLYGQSHKKEATRLKNGLVEFTKLMKIGVAVDEQGLIELNSYLKQKGGPFDLGYPRCDHSTFSIAVTSLIDPDFKIDVVVESDGDLTYRGR